ncbi:MAG: hypothetical protein NUK65_01680 [Firmicutes bacterium]|nr:hypothetical protein [Bacillota bacterium]
MFENDYTINGKHATYLKYMVIDAKIFTRYIDVYMNAAVWGLLYGRNSQKDPSADRARIYADAFANERENCVFLYRLTMMLDESTPLTPVERVDRTFRDDAQNGSKEKLSANLEIFHGYVLGGIEVLYERYIDGCTTQNDYLSRIHELMSTFKDEISGISYEDKLAKLMNG